MNPDIYRAFNPARLGIPPDPTAYSYAETQFEIIKRHILEFQATLDDEHDIEVLFANFGSPVSMQVTQIRCERSVLMVFKGYVNGRMATLIQHASQLNFLLTTVPKKPDAPHRTIGFTANLEAE